MYKNLILHASLRVAIGFGAPILTALISPAPITWRVVAAMIVGAIIGGAGALEAFLSTTYAASPVSKFSETFSPIASRSGL